MSLRAVTLFCLLLIHPSAECAGLRVGMTKAVKVKVDEVDQKAREAKAAAVPRTTSITVLGITWTFDKPYQYGTFANGDYWVVPDESGGRVAITSIDPAATSGRNGWQVNPADYGTQAFDDRASFYTPGLIPALPYHAAPGSSIVKAISCNNDCAANFVINAAAVLTVLDHVPTNRGATLFRPAYVGTVKKSYSLSDIRWDRVPSFTPPPSSVPTIESLKRDIANLQLDHFYHWGASLHPYQSMPWYGAEIASRNSDIAIRLALNDSNAQKMGLMIPFLQYGIDLSAARQETNMVWQPGGGHGYGRLMVLSLTALLLGDQDLALELQTSGHNDFGETGAVVLSNVTNKVLYGELVDVAQPEFKYWEAFKTHSTYRTHPDPYGLIDGGENPGYVYPACCSIGPLKGGVLALTMYTGASSMPSSLNFVDYTKRMISSGALTQPDVCAPATGVCTNNSGLSCTTANYESVCGASNSCDVDMTKYGVTFGPNGSGSCILDSDSSDGTGRFPQNNGEIGPVAFFSTFQAAALAAYGVQLGLF